MECWDYYCYYPWPVEVTVQSGSSSVWIWLGPVLLFGASLVASGVAYLGIRKSNETNRAAIEAADDREMTKWRRETILKVASDLVEATREFGISMGAARDRGSHDSVELSELERLRNAVKSLRDSSDHLLLVGASELSRLSEALLATSASVMQAYVVLSDAKAEKTKRERADSDGLTEIGVASSDERKKYAKDHTELLAEPLRAFDSALDKLEPARKEFVVATQRALNPSAQTAEPPLASAQPPARQAD